MTLFVAIGMALLFSCIYDIRYTYMLDQSALLNPSIKMIIFDHDDTLVSTIQAKWAQHKYIAKEFYNKVVTDDQLRMHWGKPLTVLMQLLYETNHIDIAMSYNIATRSLFPKRLFTGTLDTLKTLKKSGIRLGLVTATTNSSLTHDFDTLRIPKKLFEYIQTEDDTTFHKPDPRVFEPTLFWLAKQKIDKSEVIYIGDQLSDMIAARGAGFGFIGVGTGLVSVEEFANHEAVGIKQLRDLL